MLSSRASVAAFHLAVIQLIEANGFEDVPIEDLAVNWDGRSSRVTLATMTPDGQHIGEVLASYSIDPRDLSTFGRPAPLPTTGPVS